MLSLSSGFNYYLCSEPVTLRYRHAGLRNYIKSQLHRDPTNGDIYIFLSKDSHRVRIYYFHHQGEILTEKYSIPTISSSQSSMRKRDAIISLGRALSIWLKESF